MSSDEERLIVLLEGRISQFEKAMAAAEKRGTSTYNGLIRDSAKATSAVERNILTMAETQSRVLDAVVGKSDDMLKRTAAAQRAWWNEVAKSQSQVDALRASIDPLYAASKRYEAAVEQLNEAERLGVLTATQKAQIMERLGAEYLGAAATTQRLGAASNETRMRIQGVGFQVQDTAVQIAAGTEPMQALSMQLPQLASAFGTVGVVIGTLAAVGLPVLGAALSENEAKTRTFDDALEALENSVRAVNDVAAIYTAEGLQGLADKYGTVTAEVLALVEAKRQLALAGAMADADTTLTKLYDDLRANNRETFSELALLFDIPLSAARKVTNALDDAMDAVTFEDKAEALTRLRTELEAIPGGIDLSDKAQREFYQSIVSSEEAMKQLAASAPRAGWLAAAIDGAADLASNFWEAARARAAALADDPPATGRGDPRKFGGSAEDIQKYSPAAQLAYGNDYTPPRSSGGRRRHGGGGEDRAIDRLLADLETQRETVAAWYQESLDTLNSATDAQLAAVGGRHEALERLEVEHQERLRGIRDAADGTALTNAETLFGGLANIASAGGDKMIKAARIFGAAEALINTYRAQAAVLATPGLSVWGRFAAYAAIGAAGLRVVTAIKGGGSSGAAGGGGSAASSGSSGSSPSTSVEAAAPLRVSLEEIDPNALFSGRTVRALFDKLSREAGTRGVVLVGGGQ